MKPLDRIFVAGHRGMVGSAIVRALKNNGFHKLILRSHAEVDLTRQADTERLFQIERPNVVVMAAAFVGGIYANDTYPADFIYRNVAMQSNIMHSAWLHGADRLLFLGSSCIYPKDAPQPIEESHLLTGPLEKTNEAYAIAKIAGIKMCAHYRNQYGNLFYSAMPSNLYGTGDNYHAENSHVIPGLIRRFHEAKIANAPSVVVWGTGRPRREFLHVDDLAEAVILLLQLSDPPDIVNVGAGEDIAVADLAILVANTVGYKGDLQFDTSKPDGTFRKLMDSSRIRSLGWMPNISLEEGLKNTYKNFLSSSRM